MIMMNGNSPVPGSGPEIPISPALPSNSGSLETAQFPNGPPACTGCGQPIQDEFILRVQGHFWHAHCLRCAACQTSLTHTCYVRGTRVFCRMDFFRMFGASCTGCGEVIPPSEVVRTAHENIYHLKCFVCVVCTCPLNTGDEFYLRDDGQLICKRDFQKHQSRHHQQDHVTDQQTAGAAAAQESTDYSQRQDLSHSQQQLQPQQQTQQTLGNLGNLVFTPQETKVLQEIYHACPNPSHDTLQRISSQHGLDVTRVRMWLHVHRKGTGMRENGEGYSTGNQLREEGMERAAAPPGGYPLPIVNEVSSTSSGRLPTSSRTDAMCDVPFPVTSSSCSRTTQSVWPLSDEVWRSDFVPPNVDLNPCDIKDGEVCNSRRGLPPSPLTPDHCAVRGQQCCFMPGSSSKGSNCQQDQLLPTTHGQGDVPAMSWINS